MSVLITWPLTSQIISDAILVSGLQLNICFAVSIIFSSFVLKTLYKHAWSLKNYFTALFYFTTLNNLITISSSGVLLFGVELWLTIHQKAVWFLFIYWEINRHESKLLQLNKHSPLYNINLWWVLLSFSCWLLLLL